MTVDAGVLTGSRAVLIGVSAYEYVEFPPIRAARNSVHAMRSLLEDPALCAWPPDRITVIANPISAAGLATSIADLAEDTTGALLLYYAGHGVLSAGGELCLTVTSTRPDRPKISGLPWDTVAEVLRTCPAAVRLAILDCCFAGQAIEALTSGGGEGLADIAHAEGVYTLTATIRNRPAHVPPPGQQDDVCTSFTGELQDLVRCGIPGKAPQLTLSDIYPVLRQRLRSKGLPAPGQRGTSAGGQFCFTANAAVPAGPSARDLPAGVPGSAMLAHGSSQAAGSSRARHSSIITEALRAAHSISSDSAKARALAAIAGALAATDPGRASRLIIDADRVTQSITSENARAQAVAAVAGPLAAADADRAERAAQSITSESPKAQALAAAAQALAATDPDRASRLITDAERLALSIPDPNARAVALAAVAAGLAAIDSDHAERLARSISRPAPTAMALAALAKTLAPADPDRANRLLVDAERLAHAISGASSRAPTLAAIAEALAATDPDHSARLITDAEHLAQSIPDPNAKAAALAAVTRGLAATDPGHAERLAHTITSANFRAPALAAAAKALVTTGPSPAGQRITGEPGEHHLHHTAERDPNLGPGRRIVSKTASSGVSRLAGQAGLQGRHYAQTTPNSGKHGRVGHNPITCRPHVLGPCQPFQWVATSSPEGLNDPRARGDRGHSPQNGPDSPALRR